MAVLVIAEHDHRKVRKATLNTAPQRKGSARTSMSFGARRQRRRRRLLKIAVVTHVCLRGTSSWRIPRRKPGGADRLACKELFVHPRAANRPARRMPRAAALIAGRRSPEISPSKRADTSCATLRGQRPSHGEVQGHDRANPPAHDRVDACYTSGGTASVNRGGRRPTGSFRLRQPRGVQVGAPELTQRSHRLGRARWAGGELHQGA